MGVLVAKCYPTKLFLKAADHSYVECGTGAKGWKCWGGKSGGTVVRSAIGSTQRADKIAGTSEKAGITCYLVNGVCHQAANRILLPAGITVRGVRGYGVSEAMFGTYGRVGFWPCSAPFYKHPGTSGDLSVCISAAAAKSTPNVSAADQREWAYTRSVLALYEEGSRLSTSRPRAGAAMSAKAELSAERDFEAFHLALFDNMCEFNLGPRYDRPMAKSLRSIRRKTERQILAAVRERRQAALAVSDFVGRMNRITIELQESLRERLGPQEYLALMDLARDEAPIVLADPDIVDIAFRS